ncbi:unnamed protein product [Heligmosomoides polygyrus]|uniref:Transposase n=1 Tax=Heligmosomoides polygyrus TaxID=6339 RepID=A0A183GTW6_HELPZ|nr:unnamed protein product [Heligmosomoides polygyrus]
MKAEPLQQRRNRRKNPQKQELRRDEKHKRWLVKHVFRALALASPRGLALENDCADDAAIDGANPTARPQISE